MSNVTGEIQEASGIVSVGAGPEPALSVHRRVDVSGARRTLLVIGPIGTLPESLVHALEREFPWLRIEAVEDVNAAWRAFDQPVSLIMLDMPIFQKEREFAALLPEWHPNSITVLIEHGDRRSASLQQLLDLEVVRGVLPMNLRLDIWLSVVRLMLRGGEYFPLSLLQPALLAQSASMRHGPAPFRRPPATGPDTKLFDLTRREMQVLEMVSQGAQNKTIAAAFDLSEHTVKIHVHNIINKMGTNNRTEAAARFRDHCQLPTRLDAE
ncbi:response regulator transcription factor [Mesorhizobium sp. RP14(2022)]|uniref:Response regulator transcription factor n=1 Tax=Mesorhizobium liriopis TaxID=2953882 RepID=A0ABT1C2R3_9HYPH|nr:response regulator transcription factor [Mesorhizobium liriopis]MCO6049109.1 response regulator transcription factor [Mesorhizobium liriopis]